MREFWKMLKQYAVDCPTEQASLPPYSGLEGVLSANDKSPGIWKYAWSVGKRFAIPPASSSSPFPGGFNPWLFHCVRTFITTRDEWEPNTSSGFEMPVRTVSQKFIRPKWGKISKDYQRVCVPKKPKGFSKDYGVDQQRLKISDLHFDKFLTPATFACWKKGSRPRYVLVHNFLRKRCNGSRKWSWLIQWMNWDLRHLLVVFQCRILKYLMRGLLRHWTKSSIILTSKEESVWRNERPRSRTVLLLDIQIAYLIYDYFRVTGSQRVCREICRPIHYESTKWWYSGIRFQVGRNLIVYDENPTWWHLGRILQIKNTRVRETQDRIGIVRPGDSSEEVVTWLSQIERRWWKEVSNKKFEIRTLKPEAEI